MPAARRASPQQAKFTKDGKPTLPSNSQATELAKLGEKEAAEARAAFTKASKAPVTFYFDSALSQAPVDVRSAPGAVKITLPIHRGPTINRATNKPANRTSGEVILFEGGGYTTEQLWAEYIAEQWRGAIKVYKVEDGQVTAELLYDSETGKLSYQWTDKTVQQEVSYYQEAAELGAIVALHKEKELAHA